MLFVSKNVSDGIYEIVITKRAFSINEDLNRFLLFADILSIYNYIKIKRHILWVIMYLLIQNKPFPIQPFD